MSQRITKLIDGHRVSFAPMQWLLFREIYAARGMAVTVAELRAACWASQANGGVSDNTIAAHISGLRNALSGTRFVVVARWSKGYCLERKPGAEDRHKAAA